MAVPQGFRPSLTPQQVTNFKRLYDQQPDNFNEQTVEQLQLHAEYYRLPFAESNKSVASKVGSVMGQAGKGFLEGFTTFKVKDAPKNDAEAIARNVGHLAGFVGYIPSMPFKLLGAQRLANAAKAAKGRSIPMLVANKAQEAAGKIVKPIQARAIVYKL